MSFTTMFIVYIISVDLLVYCAFAFRWLRQQTTSDCLWTQHALQIIHYSPFNVLHMYIYYIFKVCSTQIPFPLSLANLEMPNTLPFHTVSTQTRRRRHRG